MFAAHLVLIEVLFVDALFVAQFRDVRNVDLNGSIAQRLHELVVEQAIVFSLVGVADDDLINVRLSEFLGFDAVFLRSTQEIVKKGNIKFQNFNELYDTTIGDVEFTIKVEGARVRVRTVLSNFSIVNVTG